MRKLLLAATLLFAALIVTVVVSADRGRFPPWLEGFYRFPGGDKVGHFILFGILSFLLNKSALLFFPKREPTRLVLTVSLLLSIGIGLEEWSQSLFPTRTMSLIDLMASYAGVIAFALLAYRTAR